MASDISIERVGPGRWAFDVIGILQPLFDKFPASSQLNIDRKLERDLATAILNFQLSPKVASDLTPKNLMETLDLLMEGLATSLAMLEAMEQRLYNRIVIDGENADVHSDFHLETLDQIRSLLEDSSFLDGTDRHRSSNRVRALLDNVERKRSELEAVGWRDKKAPRGSALRSQHPRWRRFVQSLGAIFEEIASTGPKPSDGTGAYVADRGNFTAFAHRAMICAGVNEENLPKASALKTMLNHR